MPSNRVMQSLLCGAAHPDVGASSRSERARRGRRLALIAGALALAGGALALPTPASAIVIIGGTPASFSGVGITRSSEALSINGFQDPNLLPAGTGVASWRPAGAPFAIELRLGCVSIEIGRVQSTLHASGRSATGEYFVVHAVDAGIGNPDAFGVRRSATPPTGFQDPNLKCGARDVATSPVAAGNYTAVGNPEI